MTTFLLVLLGLYALWICTVFVHTSGRSEISSDHWMYRVYYYWHGEDTQFRSIYTRDLVLLPPYIVIQLALIALLFIIFVIIGAIVIVVARTPFGDDSKPSLKVFHPPSP